MKNKKQSIHTEQVASESKKILVTQIKSPIGRHYSQKINLKGLGLDKMHKSSLLNDNSSVRGMINKVSHLVKVEKV